ncbi:GntR family transcriptional regulator [Oceaniovalibus sp. ACAM 378]|uniref:GntR family transcriptional regulator n=1 Tax=Oceaniovalibus sp. ACAM 378 TaxID=2599923 RepID=UPI001CA33632|nr:GntR family transcriptional regulator [Oceaniovalibus sp. ACAM 378]
MAKTKRNDIEMFGEAKQSEIRLTGEDASSAVAAALEEDIVLGRLQPRERLIEEDLAARFKVKRHLVRQAIMDLERLGLVERVRNRGAVVRFYSAQEVEDINAVRDVLEGHAASLVALPVPDDELANLSEIEARHVAAIDAGLHRETFRTNLEFHRHLFGLCGNPALIAAIDTHAQKSHAYRSILASDRSYQDWAAGAHLAMIDAMRRGDRDTLVRLCREHLIPAKNRYIETWNSRFM